MWSVICAIARYAIGSNWAVKWRRARGSWTIRYPGRESASLATEVTDLDHVVDMALCVGSPWNRQSD